MPPKKNLIAKYNREQKRSKILELIGEGESYAEIANKIGVSRQFVNDTLKEELASATTPEKILELRNHQTETLTSQTPRLFKRFLKQNNLTERLADKYESMLDDEDEGLYSYQYLLNLAKEETYNNWYQNNPGDEPDEDQQGKLNREAHNLAQLEIDQYRYRREQLAKEMERTAKLGDQHYQTILKQQERLAKLHGLDTPVTNTLMIHRSDDIKISLMEDIKATQQQLEAQTPIEAEVVDEEPAP